MIGFTRFNFVTFTTSVLNEIVVLSQNDNLIMRTTSVVESMVSSNFLVTKLKGSLFKSEEYHQCFLLSHRLKQNICRYVM